MRYVTIGRYQFSVILLLIAVVASPVAFAASYYIWSTKTVPFSVEEPLSVTSFPESIHFNPGENATLDITISNTANVNYTVELVITLSDPNYQQAYVQASNQTYTIVPGENTISAWVAVNRTAPQSQQQLTVDFLRL
jgi:uncharacterized membrane protein